MTSTLAKLIYFPVLCVFVTCAAAQDNSQDVSDPLTHGTFLDPAQFFHLGWRYNSTHVDLQISARTLGWVALGISPNGGMNQSDVLLGWVDDSSAVTTVQDRWNTVDTSTGVNLLLDTQQDWVLVRGSQNESHTTIRAIRALETCDHQDRPFTQDTLRMIYSYHTNDPEDPSIITKHTQRGTRSVLLFSPSFLLNRTDSLTTQEKLQQMDIRVDHVSIPANLDTLYYCKLIRLPAIERKYHIIGIKPLIDRGNEALVHHVLVYLCTDQITDQTLPMEFDCNHGKRSESIDQITSSCQTVMAAWAIGGNDIYFPEEAGLPLNPELSGRYFLIEIHYNNPNPPPGPQIDSSGVTFVMTENLRMFDAATMNTGVMNFNYLMTIPPNESDFVISGHCEADCSSTAFPAEGIHIFQALLHTHLRGRKVFLRQIRDGKELEPIALDDNFDFSYQEARTLNPPRTVLSGDKMIAECHYAGKAKPTFGGFSTQDEMCLVYITYYPATLMDSCGSSANSTQFIQLINYTANSFQSDVGDSADSMAPAIENYLTTQYSWNRANSAKLQDFYRAANYIAICGVNNNTVVIPNSVPKTYTPYTEPSNCAMTSSGGQLPEQQTRLQAIQQGSNRQLATSGATGLTHATKFYCLVYVVLTFLLYGMRD